MACSIIIQSTYTSTHVGLYQDSRCIDTIPDIHQASTALIPSLDTLVTTNNITLKTISFIGAYQGPGPFTSLRVILASVNGIAFAHNIPLIGVDGIDALLEEHTHETFSITVALLNAYNKDAYFGIQWNGKIVRKGYDNIDQLLIDIQNEFPKKQIRFIGQGVPIFRDQIMGRLRDNAYLAPIIPESPSLDMIAQKSYKQWQEKNTANQLLPLYLKTLAYKKSIT